MASEYVPNQILTAEELNGSFDGKTDNADAKISGGYADGLDHVTITGIGASVSPTSGALIVTGGVGVGGSLNVANASIFGKELKVLSSLNTTSPSTGALTVAGGVGIGSNVQVGGAVAVVGNLTGARIVSTDATQATSVSTGAVVTPGGLGVAKDTWIGGDLHVQGAFAAQGGATLQGGITVDSVTLNPGGDITYGDGTTQSTKPFDDVPTDGIKYGRKDKAWFVIADLPEAPADGKKYGRKDAAWTVLTDILEAPGDGFYYGRRNAAWAKVTEEAPMADAFIYGRANGLWVKSVTEAPSDGNQYSRRNGAWQVLSASGMWVGDVPPSDTARYPQWYDTASSTLYVWYNDGTSSQWVICVPVPSTDDMSGAVWGAITGELTDQTDLNDALALKLDDAPSDTKQYARQDGAWAVVVASGGTGITDAPSDGNPYARQNAAWIAIDTKPIGAEVTTLAGSGTVVLPAYLPLQFDEVTMGSAVTIQDPTSALINVDGPAVIEVSVSVLHNWGSSVVFGFSVDDGPVKELGRIVVESDDPVLVSARYNVTLNTGGIGHLWISSDFEWSEFSWTAGMIQIMTNDSVGVPEAPQDGQQYARQDAGWAVVESSGGGIPDAPDDGQFYGRKNANWSHPGIGDISDLDSSLSSKLPKSGDAMTGPLVLFADPVDPMMAATKQYVDNNAGGIPEAPEDGKQYARQSGAWTENTGGVVGPAGSTFDGLKADSCIIRFFNPAGAAAPTWENCSVTTAGTQSWRAPALAASNAFSAVTYTGSPAGVVTQSTNNLRLRNTTATPNFAGFRYCATGQFQFSGVNAANDNWQLGVANNGALSALQKLASNSDSILFGRDGGDAGNMRIVVRKGGVTTQDINTGLPYTGTYPCFSFEIDARKADIIVTAMDRRNGATFSTTIVQADLPLPATTMNARAFFNNGNSSSGVFTITNFVCELMGFQYD